MRRRLVVRSGPGWVALDPTGAAQPEEVSGVLQNAPMPPQAELPIQKVFLCAKPRPSLPRPQPAPPTPPPGGMGSWKKASFQPVRGIDKGYLPNTSEQNAGGFNSALSN